MSSVSIRSTARPLGGAGAREAGTTHPTSPSSTGSGREAGHRAPAHQDGEAVREEALRDLVRGYCQATGSGRSSDPLGRGRPPSRSGTPAAAGRGETPPQFAAAVAVPPGQALVFAAPRPQPVQRLVGRDLQHPGAQGPRRVVAVEAPGELEEGRAGHLEGGVAVAHQAQRRPEDGGLEPRREALQRARVAPPAGGHEPGFQAAGDRVRVPAGGDRPCLRARRRCVPVLRRPAGRASTGGPAPLAYVRGVAEVGTRFSHPSPTAGPPPTTRADPTPAAAVKAVAPCSRAGRGPVADGCPSSLCGGPPVAPYWRRRAGTGGRVGNVGAGHAPSLAVWCGGLMVHLWRPGTEFVAN